MTHLKLLSLELSLWIVRDKLSTEEREILFHVLLLLFAALEEWVRLR